MEKKERKHDNLKFHYKAGKKWTDQYGTWEILDTWNQFAFCKKTDGFGTKYVVAFLNNSDVASEPSFKENPHNPFTVPGTGVNHLSYRKMSKEEADLKWSEMVEKWEAESEQKINSTSIREDKRKVQVAKKKILQDVQEKHNSLHLELEKLVGSHKSANSILKDEKIKKINAELHNLYMVEKKLIKLVNKYS